MINRREMLKVAGCTVVSATFPNLAAATTVRMCPEFIVELQERQKILLQHKLAKRIPNSIDACNTACLLDNLTKIKKLQSDYLQKKQIQQDPQREQLLRITPSLIRRIFPHISDFFNVWSMRNPMDRLYWQIDNEIIQDKEPIFVGTKQLTTRIKIPNSDYLNYDFLSVLEFELKQDKEPIFVGTKQIPNLDYLNYDLLSVLEFELKQEIIRTGLKVLLDKTPVIYCKYNEIKQAVTQACEEIHQETNLDANYLIAGVEIVYPSFLINEEIKSGIGVEHVGQHQKLKLYTDALFPTNCILVGHKGDLTGGYTMAPYMPLMYHRGHDDTWLIHSRFSHRLRSNKMYRKIMIKS